MPKRKTANYMRTKDGDTITYTVIPARGSRLTKTFIVIFSLITVLTVIGLTDDAGPYLTLFILAVAFFMLWLLWGPLLQDSRLRHQSDILISPQGLTAGGVLYPSDDIAELTITSPASPRPIAVSTPSIIAGGTGKSGEAMFLAGAGVAIAASSLQVVGGAASAIGARQGMRSLKLMLRRRSTPDPIMVAYGLTHEVGIHLLDELTSDLRDKTERRADGGVGPATAGNGAP